MNCPLDHDRPNLGQTKGRRVTHRAADAPRPAPRTRMRWDRGELWANLIVAVGVGTILVWMLTIATAPADHGGAPRCTDAIADAGGICWGEPQ